MNAVAQTHMQASELMHYAQILKVRPVLTHEDLPTGTSIVDDEALIKSLRRQMVFAVCKRGVIYTSTPQNVSMIQTLSTYIQRQGIPTNEVRVVPTAHSVVRRLLDNERHDTGEALNGSQSDLTTDAQMILAELIQVAEDRDASDIHLTIQKTECTVEMRIDGLLQRMRFMKRSDAEEICQVAVNWESAIDGGANKSFTMMEPVDASFHVNVLNGRRKIRFSSVPLVDGCKAVLRLLEASSSTTQLPTLEALGYLPEQWLLIERIATTPQGLVVVTGPTGSGKSTTLAACMSMMPSDKAIYSYEDPIENVMPNVRQVPVNPESDNCNWVSLSKNSLRMDPDVIMYGELRETAVADVIITAASTGHLVLTTLHTNSAPSTVQRLNDLGISYHRLADPGFLRLLIFQRLLAKVCPDCSVELNQYNGQTSTEGRLVERLRKHYHHSSDIKVRSYDPECSTCSGTGLKGRTLVAEVIQVDQAGREYIEKGDLAGWLAYLYKQGWKDIKYHAEKLITSGQVCPLFAQTTLGIDFSDEGSSFSFDYNEFSQIAQSMSASD